MYSNDNIFGLLIYQLVLIYIQININPNLKLKKMKHLFIYFIAIAATSFSSCSKNNAAESDTVVPTSFLKALINGVEVEFTNVKVVKQVVSDQGEPYTDLIVTATAKNDSNKTINFNLEYLQLGTETCYYFNYTNGNLDFFSRPENSLVVNITTNTTNNLKGTFIGKLYDASNTEFVTIPNGSFDIIF